MSTIRNNIIKALCSHQFISGETLAKQNGVSRAAIAKHIQLLQQMGLSIFSVKGRGYQLQSDISLLNTSLISAGLRENQLDNKVEVFPSLTSTNDYLLSKIDKLLPGQVCLAEHQTAGRGRRGRVWQSPFGSHLYCSVFWPLEKGLAEAMGLSLVVGVAVAETLNELYLLPTQLKWPNDIYVNSRKLAGILVDIDTSIQEETSCVIGIGINVAMPEQIGQIIDQPWIDIQTLIGTKAIDRNVLVISLITKLMECLAINKTDGLRALKAKWQNYDYLTGKTIMITQGDNKIIARYEGIDDQGALIASVDGVKKIFYGGEISVREK
jgi:BirA family biotin operon repressor/biotin-[acetyl-CoA-carboxylase] ligase